MAVNSLRSVMWTRANDCFFELAASVVTRSENGEVNTVFVLRNLKPSSILHWGVPCPAVYTFNYTSNHEWIVNGE